MTASLPREWLEAVETLELVRGASLDEARLNTLWFGLDGLGDVSTEALTGFVAELTQRMVARAEQLELEGTAYSWFDAASGTLRISFSSFEELPFGCEVRRASSPTVLAEAILAEDSPGLIPWEELDEGEGEEPVGGVEVWCESTGV